METGPSAESVLLIPVPQAEALVSGWRQKHDPSASAGMPTHITTLYPFMPPPSLGATELSALAEIFESVTALHFRLVEARRFDGGVIYLAPEPAPFFVDLTEAVAQRFPQWPPYQGRFEDIVPHLTIADGAEEAILDDIEREVVAGLPLSCYADEVLLMTGSNETRWDVSHRWPLTAPS